MTEKILWRPILGNPNAIEVNLDADPKRPPYTKAIMWRWGKQEGWVIAEWRDNDLWVDGVRQERHREQHPKRGLLSGLGLQQRIEKRAALQIHPNVMDAVIESGVLPVSFAPCSGRVLIAWGLGFQNTYTFTNHVRCFSSREDGTWGAGSIEINGTNTCGRVFYQSSLSICSCV